MILSVCPNPSVDTFVWVDDLSPGKVHRAAKEEHFPGGKGLHVALAAAELQHEVLAAGIWAGPTGQWLRQQCAQRNVQCVGPEAEGWSRTCISFKSTGEYDETELLGCGPQIDDDTVAELIAAISAQLPQTSVVTLSGSWPPGAPTDSYARLIALADKADVPVLLDCTGKLFDHAVAEHPYAVHLNQAEAAALMGTKSVEESAARLSQHCRLAIVTDGANGAWFSADNQILHFQCPVDKVVSSVGSGDCLMAGLACGMEKGSDWKAAANLAVACAAANCLRPELGMLRNDDVQRLIPAVRCKVIKTG